MSFKLKLVVHFVVLALLPLATAFVAFGTSTERREEQLVAARLDAALRASAVAFDAELDAAEREAAALARDPAFQSALAEGDAAALASLVRTRPRLRVVAGPLRIGRPARHAVERRVRVTSETPGSRPVVVAASVPLDQRLLARLRERAQLSPTERIVFVQDDTVIAPRGLRGRVPRGAETAVVGGTPSRVRSIALPGAPSGTRLAAVAPQAALDAAVAGERSRLLLRVALALLLVAAVAYVEGRVIVRTIRRLVEAARGIAAGRLDERVPAGGRDELAVLARTFNEMAAQLEARARELEVERRRLRDATQRFADALAATHRVDELLRTVLETVVEVTGASGGRLVPADGPETRIGETGADRDELELTLASDTATFGKLMLTGAKFGEDARRTAELVMRHAAVALENAQLHRLLERQALVDELTGLANRRRADDVLAHEIARAQRYADSCALVLADLDGFKSINDTHGHQTGDAVLREFGDVLRTVLREVDVAARWGGEEFALVLPGTDAQGGAEVAERVRRELARRRVRTGSGRRLRVTASFGVAAFPDRPSPDLLVAAADAALYASKRSGKDRVTLADAVRRAS